MLHGVCGETVSSSSDCCDLGIISSDDSGSDGCGSKCNESVGSGLVGIPNSGVTCNRSVESSDTCVSSYTCVSSDTCVSSHTCVSSLDMTWGGQRGGGGIP